MADSARLVAQLAPRRYEIREVPIPDPAPDQAVIRIEANSICGTDLQMFLGWEPADFPVAPGHEPLGVIERLGPDVKARWGVEEGDRVAIGSSLACGRCVGCLRGQACLSVSSTGHRKPNLGYRDPGEAPGLWGGFATHMCVPKQVVLRPIGHDVDLAAASFFNALGNGWHWAFDVGGVKAGDRVVILGPGPRGLASTAVSRAAGAAHVVVVGLPADRERLDIALRLGADAALEVGPGNLTEQIRGALPEPGVDLVVDCTSGGDGLDAVVPLMALRGRIALGGLRNGHGQGLSTESLDRIVLEEIEVRGARSTPLAAMDQAIRLIESGQFPFEAVTTHAYTLDQAEDALLALAGERGERPIHARIEP